MVVFLVAQGTTDVLASDTVRVLSGRMGNDIINAMDRWVSKALGKGFGTSQFASAKTDIIATWETLRDRCHRESHEHLISSARDILFHIADIIMGILLIVDAECDTNPAAIEVCLRFLKGHGLAAGGAAKGLEGDLKLNQKIVYGDGMEKKFAGQSKL